MPQGIDGMAVFAGAIMLGAVPAFLAYPNFKIEAGKYRSGLAGVTANLKARAVVVDRAFPDQMLDYVAASPGTILLRAGCGSAKDNDPPLPGLEVPPDSIAFIQHSAGTTGLQKGVALTHAAVLRQLELLGEALQLNHSDRIYSWLPLYHDMGLIACFMLPMASQVPVVIQSPVDWVMYPETMLQVISQHQCTLAWLPNFAFQFVPRRAASGDADYDLSSLRALINCSEPVRAESMREFMQAFGRFGLKPGVLQCSYAMAENVFAITQSSLTKGPAVIWVDGQRFRAQHRIVPIPRETPGAVGFTSSGRLLPGHEVRIVDESGSQLPQGWVGEILIRSDCLFNGYFNRPDLTEKAFVNGWYSSGDLGFYLDDELYVVGRKKDLIIVCGENIYPHDIEEIVCGHPAVHDGRAIAMGVYDPELGSEEILVVAEVERENLLKEANEIERELRQRIAAAIGVTVRQIVLKAPKWIVKSSAGKAARSATREKLFSEHPELFVESV